MAKQGNGKRRNGKPKHPGRQRHASPTVPAVIDTPQGPILIYRLPLGRIGIMHPPEHRVLRQGEGLKG